MKKYFLVSLLILGTLFSCSSSDDDSSSVDPIVGTWKIVAEYEDEALVQSDACDLVNELVFYADNTISSEIYLDLNDDANCSLWATSKSEWKNQDGLYHVKNISITYAKSNGTIMNQNPEFKLFNITFLDHNNQMEVLYEEEYNNTTTLIKTIYQRQ